MIGGIDMNWKWLCFFKHDWLYCEQDFTRGKRNRACRRCGKRMSGFKLRNHIRWFDGWED